MTSVPVATARRARPIARLVLIAWLAAALAAPAARAAEGTTEQPLDDAVLPGLSIGLAEAPAELADDPRAHTAIIDHLNPGATITRRIRVGNGTDAPMTVRLYATAASTDDGWVVADGVGGNDLAGWISVDPPQVVVPAGKLMEVAATIRVPADASGGERYAAILAEGPPGDEGGVSVVPRVGVRVYLSVAGGGPAPVSDFTIDTLRPGRDAAGRPFVIVGVRNTGERALDIAGTLLLLDGPGSLTAGPFPVAFPVTVGIGRSAELSVPLDASLPAGPWRARAELASGLVARVAEAVITFPTEPGALADPVEATPIERQRRVLIPMAALLILLTLLLILLIAWRRRKDEEDEEDEEGSAAAGREPVTAPTAPDEPGTEYPR